MRKVLLLSLIGICAFASASLAQIVPPTTELSEIPSGSYRLDPTHVSIVFSVSHYGFSQYTGTFDDVEGELEFETNDLRTSRLRIAVDASSLDGNNEMLETRLEGSDFFDVANHPEITFESTQIEVTGATTGRILGTLTIHGLRRPITLEATLNGFGRNALTLQRTLGFSATTTISRSEWGMDAFPTMVGDDITLRIEAEFLKRNFEAEEDDSVFN